MKRTYKPHPDRQRRQTHRRRLALGRALHQILAMRRPWLRAWNSFQLRRGPQPTRIKVPKLLKNSRVRLYRIFTSGR
jgi:hypothetical protein